MYNNVFFPFRLLNKVKCVQVHVRLGHSSAEIPTSRSGRQIGLMMFSWTGQHRLNSWCPNNNENVFLLQYLVAS